MMTTSATASAMAGPDANAAEPASKRPFLIVGAVVLAGLLAIGGYMMRTRGRESTDDAQVEGDVVAISVRVAGLVVSVPVEDNRHVKKGDLIAQIDDADSRTRLDRARAELAQARAQAAQAEAQEQITGAGARGGIAAAQALVAGSSHALKGAHADIASARAAVERADAEAKSTDVDLARDTALRADNVVSQSKLEAVQTAADRAHAALSQARAVLESSEEQRHAVDAKVTEAQGRLTQSAPVETQLAAAHANTDLQRARVQASEAEVVLAQSQLDATRVVAPIAGLLTNLSLHPGVLATVGTPVAMLVPPDTYVVANFKETQIGEMRPGQPVKVSVDAFARRTFDGKVDTIAGGTQGRFSLLPADNSAGNFVKVVQRVPVRIRLIDAANDPALLPGLSADVTVTVR